MKDKLIKCQCCKKPMIDMFNRKYCSSCARFTSQLRRQISYYKTRLNAANIKLYGTENGAERIRDHTITVIKEVKNNE